MEERELSAEEQNEVHAIVEKFLGLMSKHTGKWSKDLRGKLADLSGWYVGVAENDANLVERLAWHYVTDEVPHEAAHASSTEVAREVERFFVHELETDGGTGGGTNPVWVYVYKKTRGTRERE